MKDRAPVVLGLALAKELLDLLQLAVSQHGLQRCLVGFGSQHEDAIKARLLGELAGIDLECRSPRVVLRLRRYNSDEGGAPFPGEDSSTNGAVIRLPGRVVAASIR